MLERAVVRGGVWVLQDDNSERLAALLCWRARGSAGRARVQYLDGRQRNVPVHLVRPQ